MNRQDLGNKSDVKEDNNHELLSDQLKAFRRAYESEHQKKEYVSVSFYKGDILNVFKRKTDGRDTAIIKFPNNSIYAGWIFFYPADWIRENSNSNPEYSSNKDRRWISLKINRTTKIIKSSKNEKGDFVTVDEKDLTAIELKEAMKRSPKK